MEGEKQKMNEVEESSKSPKESERTKSSRDSLFAESESHFIKENKPKLKPKKLGFKLFK